MYFANYKQTDETQHLIASKFETEILKKVNEINHSSDLWLFVEFISEFYLHILPKKYTINVD